MAFGVDDAALAAGAASVIGSGISAVGQASMNRKTREFNQQEAEKARLWSEKMYNEQNAWNYRMWNEQNEYNSPAAQIQRMREAGLNPLYYGLDGSSAEGVQAAQPLGYERASIGAQTNPFGSFAQAGLLAAQVSSIELDNELKKKELGWYDKEHQQQFDFKAASIDEIRKGIEEADSRIKNNEMDTDLKAKNIDKLDAEIAVDVAREASIGLDNKMKEQLNPLMVRAQELENQLSEVRNQFEAERILAELAETKAHCAALYAQAALAGAEKEGVELDNIVKKAESRFAAENAQNRSNLLRWTSREKLYETSILKNTWKGTVSMQKYYAEHYEEAFRNSWSRSGVEYGWSEKIGNAIGTAALLGIGLAF